MFHRSPLLTRMIAALGLALLSINGAQQCRALCLLADCHAAETCPHDEAAQPRSCGTCCKPAKPTAASPQHRHSGDELCDDSHSSDHCPSEQPCACCASPVPTQTSSVVDSQEVLDAMPLDGNLTAVVQYLNRHSERVSDAHNSDLPRTVSVCAELCRFII
ncbi:hypothetical protein PLANPX_5653 [Lacipirellula parvula]|uniref:Secreted protein n=2 Tax=Lacipirellula parvula TaxID=2650471 RepID=A0A5K7XL91_9BACT|nr:hypothetical protein PLANPX_5653 [Lacipirellula parvula]